jgi:hypothetical protein
MLTGERRTEHTKMYYEHKNIIFLQNSLPCRLLMKTNPIQCFCEPTDQIQSF